MFILGIAADVSNNSLLLGFMPESLGLLVFGFILIAFAVSLRWIFNRQKAENDGKNYDKKGIVNSFEGN